MSNAEHRSRVYESKLNEWAQDKGTTTGEELGHVLNARMLPTAQDVRSAKLALLLLAWINGGPLSELETQYQCYAGMIKTQTEEVSWLVDAAAEVAEVMGWPGARRLGEIAECVQFGIDAPGLALARAQLPGIGRDEIRALVAAGFDSVAALREASPEVLSRYLSPSQLAGIRLE